MWADEAGAVVTVPLFSDVGTGPRATWGHAAVYATVTPALVERIGTAREVAVPLSDLRSLRTRASVLLLVRGLAALALYGDGITARAATAPADLGIYTGVPTAGAVSAWDQLRDHVVPGAMELAESGASVRARVLVDGVHAYDHRPPSRPRAEPRRQTGARVEQVEVVWTRRPHRVAASVMPQGAEESV